MDMTLFAKGVLVAVLVIAAQSFALAAPVPAGAKEGNPLPVNSVWKGHLSQRGGGPTGFDCEFTITKRDGDKFEATLYEKSDALELTYLVRGTIALVDPKDKEKGFKIEFKSYEAKDVKNTAEILGVPYTGKFDGKKIKGSWKLPEDSPFGELEGDFEFEPSKKEKE
jgi:hypothetical protein